MQFKTSPTLRSYPTGQPADWCDLVPGDLVEIQFNDFTVDRGVVDCVADDAAVIWVLMERGGKRTLLHHLDGARVTYA